MKLIPLLLTLGMLAVSGCSKQNKNEPYSPELVKKAESGDLDAQYRLGRCYCAEGVTQDYKEAVKWFTKAAEQGYVDAQVNLGECYENGQGVTKDYEEAVKWFTKAAEQNLGCAAQYKLGNCYLNGIGVAKDKKEAVKWFTKAGISPEAIEAIVKVRSK